MPGNYYTETYGFQEALVHVMGHLGISYNPNLTLQKTVQQKLRYLIKRPNATWAIGEIINHHWQDDPDSLASIELHGIPHQFLSWFTQTYMPIAFPEIWIRGRSGGDKPKASHTGFVRELARDHPDKSAKDLWQWLKTAVADPQSDEEHDAAQFVLKVSPWEREGAFIDFVGHKPLFRKNFQNLISKSRPKMKKQ